MGHPEHGVLFVATQVAKAAGLKNPHMSATKYRGLWMNEGRLFPTIAEIEQAFPDSIDLKKSLAGKRKAHQAREDSPRRGALPGDTNRPERY